MHPNAFIFFVYRYVEPVIVEIFIGFLMALYPRFFAGVIFSSVNDYTDIAMTFLGFMVLVFGIVHFGVFYILSISEDKVFQIKGLKILMICLFLGDIMHILLMGILIAWRYDNKNIILSPSYYYQFGIPILFMQGRIYVLKNAESITTNYFNFHLKL